jgi:sigma-B regulation protein RsbU (phosphoserine phosphatase)
LIYAVLDAARHQISFANAGHLPPIVRHGNACFCVSTESGLPLGISDSDFSESRIEMEPGSSVLLYSDGIVESTDLAGNEYGIGRLSAALETDHPRARNLSEDVIRFSGGKSLADDATVVLVRRTAH